MDQRSFAIAFALIFFSIVGAPSGAAARSACEDVFEARVARLEKDQSLLVTSRGQRLVTRITGQLDAGTVVIFLSGMDKDMRQWNYVRDRLARDAEPRVYAQIDLLGQGQSSELNRFQHEIKFEDQLNVVSELILQNGWQGRRIVIAGHSYGAGIAGKFASMNPGLVHDVVLFSSFVDNLEFYQPGVGGMMAAAWAGARVTGFESWYDQSVSWSAQLATMTTWPSYSFWNSQQGRLWSVLALTNGIRKIGMSNALSSMTAQTKVHMHVTLFDEVVPVQAQMMLWWNVPAASRGEFSQLASVHDSVTYFPDIVASAVRRAL